MRQWLWMAVLSISLGAIAADKPVTPQQQRMKDCNAQASGKKGDERKSFMSACLKGESAAPEAAPVTPQQRMKDCNAQATGKKGDERKQFMSSCLKNK
ncbi:phosphate starvation-inducible protein PsiF [Burkholderiaceae bacterium DAT-1]|nr:phosphate starvation-inducible protein PsiF [Burkholderiaceae bacterium DAT-1]